MQKGRVIESIENWVQTFGVAGFEAIGSEGFLVVKQAPLQNKSPHGRSGWLD